MSVIEKNYIPDRHVALFAFPFGSHPMSLLNLALKLAAEAPDVRFSFFNTAKSNDSLFGLHSKFYNCSALTNNIRSYNVDDGIPTGHVLSEHPLEAVELFLKTAPESFRCAVDSAGTKITCLLTDAFLTFAGDLAKDFDVPWIPIWSPLPCALSAHMYTDLIRDRCARSTNNCDDYEDKSLDFIPGLSDMRVRDLPSEVISEELQDSLLSQALSQMGSVLPRACTALVMNFYKELNPTALNQDLESKFRNLLNVGFLSLLSVLPSPVAAAAETDATGGLMSWLDEQKCGSVVYVGFGTVAVPPSREIIALVEALEESNIPFLWSLKDHLKTDLPEGFEERTAGQGKIVPWAPQAQVLAHDSVGVYVTHGGCNSVCESVMGGVPMICRPFLGDNHMTARMVESVWQIGVKADSSGLTKSALLRSFDLILRQEQGRLMRKRASKLKEIVLEAAGPDGSAARDFKTLLGLVSGTHNVTSN